MQSRELDFSPSTFLSAYCVLAPALMVSPWRDGPTPRGQPWGSGEEDLPGEGPGGPEPGTLNPWGRHGGLGSSSGEEHGFQVAEEQEEEEKTLGERRRNTLRPAGLLCARC